MAAGTVSGCWSHWQSEHILAVVFLGRSGIPPLPNCKDSHCDILWYSNIFYDALHSDEPHRSHTETQQVQGCHNGLGGGRLVSSS